MKIRNRLSLYFTMVSSVILLTVMIVIYISFYKFLQIDFFTRIKDRISIATRLYIEADEQSRADLSEIRKKYQEKIPGEIIRIYDAGNDAAFIPDDKQYWPDDIINKVREKGDIEYSDHGRYIVGVRYKANEGDFVILASAQDPGRIRQLDQFMLIMAAVLLVSLLVVFSIARWFSEKSLSPIGKLILQMQKINASSLHTRVSVTDENDEIDMLAKNFNQLLSQLESSFELQKAFVANASHELRTPITSIIGETEISLKQERTSGEYKDVIRSVLTESEKLNETISGLIDLAQVDLNFSRATRVPIRIDDLIWELQEFWSKRVYVNALNVRMDNLSVNESSLIINGNKALLTIAFNNIIANAFKFSGNQQVSCTLEAKDESITIKIKDQGIGIEQHEQQKIFEAFYRSDRSLGYTGTGIGLYVTNKIIKMIGGDLSVLSIPNSGTAITITFQVIETSDS